MKRFEFADALIFIVIVLLVGSACVAAQPAGPAAFVLADDSNVADAGSIGGRVFDESDTTARAPRGVRGVRVIVRSGKPGSETIVGNRLSDASGTYDFSNLRPGAYKIELDPMSLPAKFRTVERPDSSVEVKPAARINIDVPIAPQRSITGIVYVDLNGDGQFTPGKDQVVAGAYVTIDGRFGVSDANGRYVLGDLPAGRIGLLVSWPQSIENTHVVLDLGYGPVTNRVVNVPMNH